MKNFKNFIKEAHLGNPLNENKYLSNKDSYIKISEPSFRKDKNNPNFLSAYIKYDTGPGVGIALGKETMAGQIRRLSSAEALRQMEIIGRKLNDSYDLEDLDINDLENGVVELFAVSDDFIDMDPRSELSMAMLNETAGTFGDGVSDETKAKYNEAAMDEYGKPFAELDIFQKQELMRAIVKYTGPEFRTDFQQRRQGDLDDEYDGMTDYQRGRMDEDMGEWPKKLTSRYSDEYRFEFDPTYEDKLGRAKYRVIDIESGELKGTPVFGKPESLMAFDDDLIKKQGGTQSTNLGEDINDPVLMKTRAAQMKRDAIEKKDLENKSKRISAEKAIDLRYELDILSKERENILMRIEDLGFETDQTAEPEGGKKADDVGRRMEIAIKDLRAIDSKIIDIKDDLGIFDMNESVNEDEIDEELFTPNEMGAKAIEDEMEESLQETLRKNLANRLK